MRSVSEGVRAIKQVPFFGTLKTVLFLGAVAGIVMGILIFRQALYGERNTNIGQFEGATIEKVVLGTDREEKVWYWETYLENNIGKFNDTILGLKIGRRF